MRKEVRDAGNVVPTVPRTRLEVKKWFQIKMEDKNICAQQKSMSHKRRRLTVQTVP